MLKKENKYEINISGKANEEDEITGKLEIYDENKNVIKTIELNGGDTQERIQELVSYLKDEQKLKEKIKVRLETKRDSSGNTNSNKSNNQNSGDSPIVNDEINAELLGANIAKGETGGVEFNYPKPFSGYSDLFYSSTIHYVAFECSDDAENDIINTVNRLLVPEIKIKNISQIWETILSELSDGFLVNNKLPFISLHFNKNCLIYSVMHKYYKRTLVGHVLCFLDFFMKGFMNGGFYKEDFVYNWYLKGRKEDNTYLRNNFTNLKRYLLKNNLSNLNYNSLHEIGDDILFKKKQAFSSASRIIGTIDDVLKVCDNIIFPDCTYTVEGDFDIFPEFLAELSLKKEELNKFISDAQQTRILMNIKCLLIMEKIPYFKSYFLLLKMITFALNYLPTLKKNCQCPDLSNSLTNNNKPYVKNLPTIFPPIPIYTRTKIKPNKNLKEFIDMLSQDTKDELNNEIKKQKNENILNFSSYLKNKVREEIKIKYKEYLLTLTDRKKDIESKTDDELKLRDIIKKIFFLLKKYSKLQILN